jgi:hypothetical protein
MFSVTSGVAEQHHGVVAVEERIVDAGTSAQSHCHMGP